MAVGAQMDKMFGYLIVTLIATALAPTLFANANLSGVAGVPSWVVTIVPILIGVFIVLLLWKQSR